MNAPSTESRPKHTMVAVMPVAPNTKTEFIQDSVEAFRHYMQHDALLILLDDTKTDRCKELFQEGPNLAIRAAALHNDHRGPCGRLFKEHLKTMRWALERWDFDLYMKFDTDALITGSGLETQALARLELHPRSEILCKYLYDYKGFRTLSTMMVEHMDRQRKWLRHLRFPRASKAFKRLLSEAMSHDRYVYGELQMGAVILFKRSAVERMANHPIPDLEAFDEISLVDDGLFTLLAHAVRCTCEDFGRIDEPLGVFHSTLPYSPEECLRLKKCAVHSVRKWEELDEAGVRSVFRAAREAGR